MRKNERELPGRSCKKLPEAQMADLGLSRGCLSFSKPSTWTPSYEGHGRSPHWMGHRTGYSLPLIRESPSMDAHVPCLL